MEFRVMGQQFIGVYATNEKAPSIGDYPRPMGKRKRLWFVWETSEGKYKVQALNAAHQPMAEPRVISDREFESRFILEEGCAVVPEGYVPPGPSPEETARAPLPDLFMTDAEYASAVDGVSFFSGDRPGVDEKLRADDPNLIMGWIKAEPRMKRPDPGPVKIPFDRLVGEVVEIRDTPVPGQPAPAAENAVSGIFGGTRDNAEQARLLRSRFVQALLLLRRGERGECIALLQEMLARPYPFFEGGAQLFSEFGLGLRRLGLIPLALAAHKRALEFAPGDPRIFFNIARNFHDLGQLPEARDFLEQSLAVAPDFAIARQFLAFLEAGDADNAAKKST